METDAVQLVKLKMDGSVIKEDVSFYVVILECKFLLESNVMMETLEMVMDAIRTVK